MRKASGALGGVGGHIVGERAQPQKSFHFQSGRSTLHTRIHDIKSAGLVTWWSLTKIRAVLPTLDKPCSITYLVRESRNFLMIYILKLLEVLLASDWL